MAWAAAWWLRLRRQPHVVVRDNREGQVAPGAAMFGGRWAVLCEAHGTFVTVGTQRRAEQDSAESALWCDGCRADSRRRGR